MITRPAKTWGGVGATGCRASSVQCRCRYQDTDGCTRGQTHLICIYIIGLI